MLSHRPTGRFGPGGAQEEFSKEMVSNGGGAGTGHGSSPWLGELLWRENSTVNIHSHPSTGSSGSQRVTNLWAKVSRGAKADTEYRPALYCLMYSHPGL